MKKQKVVRVGCYTNHFLLFVIILSLQGTTFCKNLFRIL